jgi:outer membrane protein assembly factor BamB
MPERKTGLRSGTLVLVAVLACWTCHNDAEQQGPPASPTTSDWPTYGCEPGRTGRNAGETRLAVANMGALAPRWQADIGMGSLPPSGGPTVAGGSVFVGSSVDPGNNFFAFDATTGRLLWTASVGQGGTAADGIAIGATSAVSGTVVVAGGRDRAYYGLRTDTGAVLWRHDMDAGESGFAWASPLILGNRAYIGISSEFDNPSVRGEIRALDLETGAVLVRQAFVPEGKRGAGIWNSPAASPDGRTVVVASGEDFDGYDGPYNRAMIALDATTLEIRQAHKQGVPNNDEDWATTPVVFHDRSGRVLVGATHKNHVFYTYVLDSIATGPLWSRATGESAGLMPGYDPTIGDGGTLFIAGRAGQIYAVDPATGADRWPPVTVQQMHGNMALANGLLFVNSAFGEVFVLEATTGRILRQLSPAGGGKAYSGVAVAGGMVYWLSGSTLNAWGVP